MSTHTTNPATEPQVQTPEQPLPVAVPEPAPAETPEPVVPTEGTAQQPTPEPEVDTEAVLKEADVALRKCCTANRRGEQDLLTGKLEAGEWAARYIALRLSLGHDREPIIQAVEGDLAKTSPQAVSAGDLLGTWHAWNLLAVGQGLTEAPAKKGEKAPAYNQSYTAYRDQWSKLVRRTTTKTEEVWSLLPGVEEYARAAFRSCVEKGHKGRPVADAVADVLLKARQVQEQEARDAVAKTKAAKEAEAKREQQLRAEAKRLVEEAAKAKLAGDKPAAEALEAKAVETVQEATKATKAVEVLEAKVEAAEVKAEKAEEATKKAASKLAPKPEPKPAPKLQAPPAGTPPAGEQPPLPSKPAPILSAPVGAVELGCECADVIAECDAPEDALEALLEKLLRAGVLSKSGDRAVRLALAEMHRPSKASNPTEAPLVAAS